MNSKIGFRFKGCKRVWRPALHLRTLSAVTEPTPTRTTRFAGGVAMGFLQQVVTLLVGLWLTRFTLDHLGRDNYGLWLVGLQLLGYLSLADFGVMALLPRETAYAAADTDPTRLQRLAGDVSRLALWQTPVIAIVTLAIWLLLPGRWAELRPALAIALLAFALTFPTRIFQALLTGLQDLAFLGRAQLLAWTLSTSALVVLLLAGAGIEALAASWALGQAVLPVLCARRLRRRFPHAWPGPGRLTQEAARSYLGRSLWMSVGQVSQLLISGTDIIIIGAILGPAAVVQYVVTGKLLAVGAALPGIVAHAASPALSELRAGGDRTALERSTSALLLAVLLGGGAVVTVVLAVNSGFVTWWVGGDLYGGATLTVLMAAQHLLRYAGTALAFSVFAFGFERRLAFVGVAEGGATALLTALLLSHLGLAAAPLGSLAVVAGLTIPALSRALVGTTGTTVASLARRLLPLGARCAIVFATAFLMNMVVTPSDFLSLAALTAAAIAWYALLAGPIALRDPVRGYTLQVWSLVKDRWASRA